MKLGILLSGRGSNFEAIANNIAAGKLDAQIGFVFSNKPKAAGLSLARQMGFPTASLEMSGLDRPAYDAKVAEMLVDHKVELICLAGYMRLLSGQFVSQFADRILNIHPSLLPAFPGLDAQHQALVHGVKVTGCTVHFVDQNLDSGPILLQSPVLVEDNDTLETLSARILKEEHRIYSEAISWVSQGNYKITGRRVIKT